MTRGYRIGHKAFETAKRLFALFVFLPLGTPGAVAEVCDKVVNENWKPEDGPISLVTPISNLLWPLLIYVAVVLFVILLRSRKMAVVASLLYFLFGMFLVWDALTGSGAKDIYDYALAEGCRSIGANLIGSAVIFGFSMGLVVVGVAIKQKFSLPNVGSAQG